jgi:hypothetical protein
MKISKQTPPSRDPLLISFLRKTFASRSPENTSIRLRKMSLDTNPDLKSKVIGPSEFRKQLREPKVYETMVE